MTFTKNMFNEIKESLSNKKESSYREIMKFEPGKQYVVRLIPNVLDPKRTMFHYYHHSWNSLCTGQFVTTLCPSTYGEQCPIDQYVLKTYNTGTSEEKAKIKPITRKENWFVNAYVISDPTNPENEGKVKVIRYGKELAKIINSAIDGDDADEFGVKIFDVAEGCSLKIKSESRANGPGARSFVTYTASKFTSPSKLDGMDAKKVDALYESIIELDKIIKPKTYAELQRMMDQHFFCVQDVVSVDEEEDDVPAPAKVTEAKKNDALDSIFAGIKESASTTEPSVSKVEVPEEKPATDDTDAKLKELLASL
jgi:hypothetical protein